jgi:8-hydroxy-5-deazaflavin:NADPH oxidoreductase
VNARVMVDPARVPGEHDVFVCGNDHDAKRQVGALLQSFGWPAERIVDLGDITAARATEAYLALWLRLRAVVGSGDVNIRVVR